MTTPDKSPQSPLATARERYEHAKKEWRHNFGYGPDILTTADAALAEQAATIQRLTTERDDAQTALKAEYARGVADVATRLENEQMGTITTSFKAVANRIRKHFAEGK